MKNRILKILSSLLLVSSISLNFMGCGGSKTTQKEQEKSTRKPQVSVNKDNNNTTNNTNSNNNTQTQKESIYKHGEVITLADGSKLKYDENGNHEIIEKGEGRVVVFKKLTEDELKSFEPNQRTMIERQMQSDPNGFALIY